MNLEEKQVLEAIWKVAEGRNDAIVRTDLVALDLGSTQLELSKAIESLLYHRYTTMPKGKRMRDGTIPWCKLTLAGLKQIRPDFENDVLQVLDTYTKDRNLRDNRSLAPQVGMSELFVYYALQELEKQGWITIIDDNNSYAFIRRFTTKGYEVAQKRLGRPDDEDE